MIVTSHPVSEWDTHSEKLLLWDFYGDESGPPNKRFCSLMLMYTKENNLKTNNLSDELNKGFSEDEVAFSMNLSASECFGTSISP